MPFIVVSIPIERHDWQRPRNKPWYQYFEDSVHDEHRARNATRNELYKDAKHDSSKALCRCGCATKDAESITSKRRLDRPTESSSEQWRKKIILTAPSWKTPRDIEAASQASTGYNFGDFQGGALDFSWSKATETSNGGCDSFSFGESSRDHNSGGSADDRPRDHLNDRQ